ncbi:hypothetical protein AO377_1649 [Moraxella catarrhalis]|nr:hypothetical protein AO377_1649 [Moraxella catarrhalis]OAV18625.1 hypothetical protein AO375_0082 [Moraxella catarrhalis]OAV34077.1 hypothetical protein AO365_1297 [Moraxella catarrhalis]
MIVKSRQDTYQYTHDQKQAGFSADVGFNGKPQSFSINGGKTDVDDPNTLTQAQKKQTHQSSQTDCRHHRCLCWRRCQCGC